MSCVSIPLSACSRFTVLSENNTSQTKGAKSVVGARLAVKLVAMHDLCKFDMDSKTIVSASLVHHKIVISCSIEICVVFMTQRAS